MRKVLILFLIFSSVLFATENKKVHITSTGEKYHESYCRYLKRSKIETTLREAINRGYTACSVCRP